MDSKKTFDNIILIFAIFLAIYFAVRVIDFSKIITMFPVHVTGDIPSYMANLFFLTNYGFHDTVPYWFNGMILFLRYPPGWYYFTLPLYYLTKSITLATYSSIVIIFLAIFISLYLFGKYEGLTPQKRVAFFFFLFGNGIAIGNFLRLGRAPELFGWLWFIIVTSMLIWYKDHKIDLKFLLIIPAYAALILSHAAVGLFFHILALIPMLFIIKKSISEKAIVFLAPLLGLILTSFWWVPFALDNVKNKALSNLSFGTSLLGREDQPIMNFILNNLATYSVSLLLWVSFYLYWEHKKKSKRELLFFSPVLILNILFTFGVAFLLPIVNSIYPDVQVMGYLFFALFFLLKTPLKIKKQKIFIIILALFVISNITLSTVHTPWFPSYTNIEHDTFSLLPLIKGKFMMLTSPYETSYPHAYYSYAAVYYNVSSVYGMGTEGLFPAYQTPIQKINNFAKNKNCGGIKAVAEEINLTEIIAYDNLCETLKLCNFKEIKTNKPVCLYEIT